MRPSYRGITVSGGGQEAATGHHQGEAVEDESMKFTVGLVVIILVGILARVVFIVIWTWGAPLHGDPLSYQQTAASIANGHGYVAPWQGTGGSLAPTAIHPPLFPLVLALFDILGVSSADGHRLILAFVSAGGVAMMGLLGRRLAGPMVGLLAAAIAALNPLWVQQSGFIMSESIYLVIIPALLLAALRCLDRPSPLNVGTVGLLMGLAILTRSEAVSFIVLLGVPLVLLSVGKARQRLSVAAMLLASAGILLVPWIVRNDVQMGSPILSTNQGDTLAGSYSGATFSPDNSLYGSFDNTNQDALTVFYLLHVKPTDHLKHWTELAITNALGSDGVKFGEQHVDDLVGVVAAREGRMLGVYSPTTSIQFDVEEDGNGARGPKQFAYFINWVLLALAVVGGLQVAKQSRRQLLVISAPFFVVALNAAVFYGSTRIRTAAEPSIAVLAAVGAAYLATIISTHWQLRGRSSRPNA